MHTRRALLRSALVCAVATASPVSTAAAQVSGWDLEGDVRRAPAHANPNPDRLGNPAVWHFMRSAGLTHAPSGYTLLPQFITDRFGIDGLQSWQSPDGAVRTDRLPHVGINASGGDAVGLGHIQWPADTVLVHPLPTRMAVVGWRSPITGVVEVSGGVVDRDPACRDGIDWSVDRGAVPLASGSIPEGGSAAFDTGSGGAALDRVSVVAGRFLYFTVAPGPAGDHTCDSTGLDVTIQRLNSVSVDGPLVVFTGGEDSTNTLRVSQSGTTYGFEDVSTPVVPGEGCAAVTDNEVECAVEPSTTGSNRVVVDAGAGDDTVTLATTTPTTIHGGAGDDTIAGGPGNDFIEGGGGGDIVSGGGGTDTAAYRDHAAGVTVDIDGVKDDGNAADGPAGDRDDVMTDVENLVGGDGSDTLTGSAAPNRISGGAGGDSMRGMGGIDEASYAGRAAAVAVDIDGVADDGSALDGPEGARDNVRADIENLTGGMGDDLLTGSASANTMRGGWGGDVLSGLGGVDTVTYAGRVHPVTADLDGLRDDGGREDGATAGVRDTIHTDVENLTGGFAGDTLSAVRADTVVNVLTGKAGDDSLKTREGTTARDRLVCGTGTDRYDRDATDAVQLCETSAILP